ncbi:restriction endonuclease [Moritella dasanensis]|uniref:restriction endonuclease n=1 Tax=Moritella dasanensis TaxID=428031 RepID=UPI0002D53FC1|nr:restriction endonuclease [Moritella dasanensis]
MAIWAFNKPGDEAVKYISNSAKNGVSRFGWSWFDSANLNGLKSKPWEKMDDDEHNVWKQARFLLDITEGDWIVHINVPSWGKCLAAKVDKQYSFDAKIETDDFDDYRHCIGIDRESVVIFDRNDANVMPLVSRKLKLRGRYWRIYCEDKFHESITNLKSNNVDLKGESHGTYFLKKDLSAPLATITSLIQQNHPEKKLECFLAEVFRNIPTVENVKVNGSGWGTDYGADLIVEYKSGLPIVGLETIEKVVVQVKSYTNEHWETKAVDQIEVAIQQYDADAGMLITTGNKTEHLEQAIDKLSSDINKPISLLAGTDVARFVLKFYGDELLSGM